MVRILKVTELEARKRFLCARSEIYRQTMKLEIANVKFAATLQKRRLKSRLNVLLMAGSVLPLAGLFFARKRAKQPKQASGFLSKLFSGLKLVGKYSPWLKTFALGKSRIGQRGNITQFP